MYVQKVATLHEDSLYPVVVNQVNDVLTGCVTVSTLKIRNVADKRAQDGHHAHIDLHMVEHYSRPGKRETSRSMGNSVVLDREGALAVCRALCPELFEGKD